MRRWAAGGLQGLALVAGAGLLLALPLVATRDIVTAVFFALIFITLAASYDILGGFLGYLNLGQGAFFGLAGYAMFILIVKVPLLQHLGPAGPVLAVLAAVAFTALFARLAAYPLFQLRGAYFAMATFGLMLLLGHLITNLGGLTGGAYGLYIPIELYLPLRPAYTLALLLTGLSVALNALLARSRLGMGLQAIRQSELAAAAIGIDLFRYKARALVLSSLPSALAGCLFALYSGYIDVQNMLGAEKTLFPVIMAMLGGSGTVFGPVLGGVIVRAIDVSLKNYLVLPVPALGIYGLILMCIGLFMPQGILPFFLRRRL